MVLSVVVCVYGFANGVGLMLTTVQRMRLAIFQRLIMTSSPSHATECKEPNRVSLRSAAIIGLQLEVVFVNETPSADIFATTRKIS